MNYTTNDKIFHIIRAGKETIHCNFEELQKWIDGDLK
jgi:hypothetical protein